MIPEHCWTSSARRLRRLVFLIKENDRIGVFDSKDWVKIRSTVRQPYIKREIQATIKQFKSTSDVQTFIQTFPGKNEPDRLGGEASD